MIGYSSKTILTYSSTGDNQYGYSLNYPSRGSGKFVRSLSNFSPGGRMPVESISVTNLGGGGVSTIPVTFVTALNNNPDIVLFGYISQVTNSDVQTALKTYVDQGGVLIMFDEFAYANRTFLNMICDNKLTPPTSNTSGGGGAGSIDPILSIAGDPIITGVLNGNTPYFGTVEGLSWGNDANTSSAIGINDPSDFAVYSIRNNRATFFRYKRKNFVWNGDGGFLSCDGVGSTTDWGNICPFRLDNNDFPTNRRTANNAKIFANIMTWAIHQAEFHGINSGGLEHLP
jgi:hypothetical protein